MPSKINILIYNLSKYNIEHLEYIFIDEFIFNKYNNNLFKDKIIITNTNNTLQMIELENSEIVSKTRLTCIPEVDMVIINDTIRSIKRTKNLVDKHTIISKITEDDIIYIEDKHKKIRIIITKDDAILIEGESLDAKITLLK